VAVLLEKIEESAANVVGRAHHGQICRMLQRGKAGGLSSSRLLG
jgi:hypothetical protein